MKKDNKIKCFTAEHTGHLPTCIMSEKPISNETTEILISVGIYKYHMYDSRIEAERYILCDIDNNKGLPMWIHVYKKGDKTL